MDTMDKLPEKCFVFDPTRKRGVIVRRGVEGYAEAETELTTAEEVRDMNASVGVTVAQEKAMEAGSMFGWHVPGADPDTYKE